MSALQSRRLRYGMGAIGLVILVEGQSTQTAFANLGAALSEPDTALRLFGKPEVNGQRRMGVALARDESIEAARVKATRASKAVVVEL